MTATRNTIIADVAQIMWDIMAKHKAGSITRSRAKQAIEIIFETEYASLYNVQGISHAALELVAANDYNRPAGALNISHLVSRKSTFEKAMSASTPEEMFNLYVAGGKTVISTKEENSDIAYMDYVVIPNAFERGLFRDDVKTTSWGKREKEALKEIYNARLA